MKTIQLLLLATGITLAGRAASAPQQPQRTSAVITAPIEKVWPVIVAEIGSEYPIKVIEKSSGLITSDVVSLDAGYGNRNASKWIYPPSVVLGTWRGLRMNVQVVALEIEPGKTKVKVLCHFEAYEDNMKHAWIAAESNGSTENGLLSRVESAISSGSTKQP
jgi:hypothetical protein